MVVPRGFFAQCTTNILLISDYALCCNWYCHPEKKLNLLHFHFYCIILKNKQKTNKSVFFLVKCFALIWHQCTTCMTTKMREKKEGRFFLLCNNFILQHGFWFEKYIPLCKTYQTCIFIHLTLKLLWKLILILVILCLHYSI